MERGAIGELIPEEGQDGFYSWKTVEVGPYKASQVNIHDDFVLAMFFGPPEERLERVALFLTTEQS